MSIRRTKKVSIDGAEFTIASLTTEQVEEYLAPLEEMAGGKLVSVKMRVHQIISHALNNVFADDDGNLPPDFKPWTPERVRKNLDMVLINTLNTEVIRFSGLTVVEQPVGEQQAAPTSTPESSTAPVI